MSSEDMSLDLGSDESEQLDINEGLIRDVVHFCGGPDLIEIFGPSGSGKSAISLEIFKSLLVETDKKALFIDTERNIGDVEEIEHSNADYVYIPEFDDIYYFIIDEEQNMSDDPFGENTSNNRTLKPGYDMIVLDSIGFPALNQYARNRIKDNREQFDVFLKIEDIVGELKKYSQLNEALVIVTNQPKSDLSDEEDPAPFGDKSIFGFKEIWKTEKNRSNEASTRCSVKSFRSRQAGKGKTLFTLTISDAGVDVESVHDEEGGGWV